MFLHLHLDVPLELEPPDVPPPDAPEPMLPEPPEELDEVPPAGAPEVSAPRRSQPATAKLITAAAINTILEGENFSFIVVPFIKKVNAVFALTDSFWISFFNFSAKRAYTQRQVPCQLRLFGLTGLILNTKRKKLAFNVTITVTK